MKRNNQSFGETENRDGELLNLDLHEAESDVATEEGAEVEDEVVSISDLEEEEDFEDSFDDEDSF